MNYDIIGDIHGHCDKLEALLRTMGYRETSGTWRHPERTVIFVGDFVDRGPAQLRTVQTARRIDKDNHVRKRVRVRWWDAEATTYRTSAMLAPAERDALPDIPLPAHARLATESGKPVFFGHYWLTGTPQLQSPSAACVDFSAGKGGPLVAYRFAGEPVLTDDKLSSVE